MVDCIEGLWHADQYNYTDSEWIIFECINYFVGKFQNWELSWVVLPEAKLIYKKTIVFF